MNTVFDITSLVWAAAMNYRGGVPRYTVELMQQLQRDDSGVSLVAGVWSRDLISCALSHRVRAAWPELRCDFTHGYASRVPAGRLLDFAMKKIRSPQQAGYVEEKADFLEQALFFIRQYVLPLNVRAIRHEIPVDVYHTPFGDLSPHPGLGGRPRIMTVHDLLPLSRPEDFDVQKIEKLKCALGTLDPGRDFAICVSRETENHFLEYLPGFSGRTFVVPLAASENITKVERDTETNAILARWGLVGRRFILCVATIEPRKNIPALIEAFCGLKARGGLKDVKLVLAGGLGWRGAPRKVLELMSSQAEDIVLTGSIDDRALSALYSTATLFAYVSKAEGFGLPILEAMKCGAPVLASDCSSLPEVHGNAAFPVDPNDPGQIQEALEAIMGDERLQEELRTSGFQRESGFSWSKTASLTRVVYETVTRS